MSMHKTARLLSAVVQMMIVIATFFQNDLYRSTTLTKSGIFALRFSQIKTVYTIFQNTEAWLRGLSLSCLSYFGVKAVLGKYYSRLFSSLVLSLFFQLVTNTLDSKPDVHWEVYIWLVVP
ncbi:MAG: hypothetical protein PUP92_16275 [Rhizonema sp. PD38]|nr:hypothetical protein [Rhizonema sp. PD38]